VNKNQCHGCSLNIKIGEIKLLAILKAILVIFIKVSFLLLLINFRNKYL
jgi:hypothetical protein